LGSVCNGMRIAEYIPPHSIECIFIAGIAHRAHSVSLRRCNDAAEVGTCPPSLGLSTSARVALALATKRLDVKFVTGHLPERSWRSHAQRPPWWLIAFVLFMVLMRLMEDAYAKEKGYSGALMGTHPLRMYTFNERISSGLLLASPDSDVNAQAEMVEQREMSESIAEVIHGEM